MTARESSGNRPPQLTDEQRHEALEKGIAVRQRRAAFKKLMKSGAIDPVDALDMEQAQAIRIPAFLDSCPGIGTANRERAIRECGLKSSRRVGTIGPRQKELLRQWLIDYGFGGGSK